MSERMPVDDALLAAVERTRAKLRRAANLARSPQMASADGTALSTSADDDADQQRR